MKQLLIVWLVCAANSVMAAPELKGNPEDLRGFLHPHSRMVSISEKAEETAYSDIALVHLVVTTEKDLLSKSLKANTDLRQTMTQQLMGSGIAADQINTSKFSSSPQYGWFGKKPDSHKVVNRMVVRITSEQHLQLIADMSDKHEEVVVSDTTFEHSQEDVFKARVKKQALQKVMLQKAFYETALGIKLKPVAFRDSPMPLLPTAGAQMVEEVMIVDKRESDSYMMSKTRSAPEPVHRSNSFDEVKYGAQVTVEFEVEK